MRFNRHDLIFNVRPTSKISPENYFPNPAGRPKIFIRSPPAGRNYFPNPAGRPNLFLDPAGRNFFPNPAGRLIFLVPNPASRFFSEPRRPQNVRPKILPSDPSEKFPTVSPNFFVMYVLRRTVTLLRTPLFQKVDQGRRAAQTSRDDHGREYRHQPLSRL